MGLVGITRTMMTQPHYRSLLVALLIAPIGCTAHVESSEDPGEAEQVDEAPAALVTENMLTPNALIPNALMSNALIPNALTTNALTTNALDPGALAAITDPGTAGTLSRMFLKYAVGCAFTSSQAFRFSWTDSSGVVHAEAYYGLLGIAASWATGPLDLPHKELVTACIAARTNYSGTQVTISLRSLQDPLKTLVGSSELSSYPAIEGAFWGNLFTSNPRIMACYTGANVAHSRAAYRECATGHLNSDGTVSSCGPIRILGACETTCKSLDSAGKFYPECTDSSTDYKTKNVGTTALP
jgi:hypothetical protein